MWAWQVPDGRVVQGRTSTAGPAPGSAPPDGTWDQTHAYSWFVGWARRDDKIYVSASLVQDDKVEPMLGGTRSRDALLARPSGVPVLTGQ